MSQIVLLKMGREHVMLAGIERLRISDPDKFISSIRAASRKAAIQAIDADFVAGREHILEVIRQSLRAKKSGAILSKRIEIDLLLRIACTNQIGRALDDVGIREGVNDALIVAIGRMKDLLALRKHLEDSYKLSIEVLKLSRRKERMLISHHKIGKGEVSACMSKNRLASLLAERANLLW